MFDIGWTEILILATISLFVIGPKDIPKFLGYIGRFMAKIRLITSEFRESVDDAIKDSELEEIKKEIALTDPGIAKNLNEALSPRITDVKNKEVSNSKIEKEANLEESSYLEKENTHKKNKKVDADDKNLPMGLKHLQEEKKMATDFQNKNDKKNNS